MCDYSYIEIIESKDYFLLARCGNWFPSMEAHAGGDRSFLLRPVFSSGVDRKVRHSGVFSCVFSSAQIITFLSSRGIEQGSGGGVGGLGSTASERGEMREMTL